MKVCFIVGTLGRGGAERQLVYMLRVLQSAGVHPRVLCLTKNEPYEREIENLGIEVEWIGSSQNRILRLLKIIANIRKRPVDIVQSTHFYTNIYVGVTGRILRIPSIGAIRSDLFSEIAASSIFGRWQLRLPVHLIANSEIAVNRALSYAVLPEEIDIVQNVVGSAEELTPRDLKREKIRLLFVGRLSEEKRPEIFIELAARLLRNLPELALSFGMAGDGPLRASLEQKVRDHGLSDEQFSFLGVQNEVSYVYRETDILVLTSRHEGTPNALLEAMAHGIPVVATRVGGVPEVISEARGVLVDPSDFDGLCSATTRLIQDADLRGHLGRNGQKYVAEVHSPRHLGEQLTGIYSRLIKGKRVNA